MAVANVEAFKAEFEVSFSIFSFVSMTFRSSEVVSRVARRLAYELFRKLTKQS